MPYLLDANVVSELRKRNRCSPSVRAWYDSISLDEIFLSVIVCGELRRGVENLRQRDPATAQILDRWLRGLVSAHAPNILPVTLEICEIWGRNPLLWPLQPADALIAATAQHRGLTVATRNERDFQRSGVDFINPFTP
jgi:hypothetical protein